MSLGTLIKEKRKSLSMTQRDLAKGICVQAMVSKIENDELKPSQDKLNKIAERLQVSVDYFEQNTISKEETDSVTMEQIIEKIRDLLAIREYDSIDFLMKAYEDEIQKATNLHEIMFFQWIQATIYEHKTGDSETAIKKLESITITDVEKEISLEIINAIARLYIRNDQFEEAIKKMETGLAYAKDKTINFKVIVKLLLNYALAMNKTKQYKKKLDVLNKGINLLLKNQSLFTLGDFYYQKGRLFRNLKEYTEAKHYYNNAYSLFDIQGNEKFRNMTQVELNEIEELMNNYTKEDFKDEEEA